MSSTSQSDSIKSTKTEERQKSASDDEFIDELQDQHREHPSPTIPSQAPKQAELEGEASDQTLLAEAKRALAYPKGRPKETVAAKEGTQLDTANAAPVVHGTPATSLAIVEHGIKQKSVNFNGINQAKIVPVAATHKAATATDTPAPTANATPVVQGTPATSLAIVEDAIKNRNTNFNGHNQAKNAPVAATPKAATATNASPPTVNATPVVHGTPATAAAIADDAIKKRKAISNGRSAAKNVAPAANSAAVAATDAPTADATPIVQGTPATVAAIAEDTNKNRNPCSQRANPEYVKKSTAGEDSVILQGAKQLVSYPRDHGSKRQEQLQHSENSSECSETTINSNQAPTEEMKNGGSTNSSNNYSRLGKDSSSNRNPNASAGSDDPAATNSRILQHEKRQIPLPSIVKERQANNAVAETSDASTPGACHVSNNHNSDALTPGAFSADQDGLTRQAPAPLRYCSFVRRSTELAETEDQKNGSNPSAKKEDPVGSNHSADRRRSSSSQVKSLVVANPIAENEVTSFYESLPKAEQLDPVAEDRTQEEQKQQRRRKTHFILGAMVLFAMVGIIAIVLGIVLSKENTNDNDR
ncbi:unknown protein [Seminavis robusta]|uniref:Uncharacterized protein n=1 Tax=Seminavis robusta TaxID=568900 RepID=A0A9N8HHW0_9STRA|nr:unknown protein [Seminavis robusta]|eukprot:Sro558_g166340.1 n/a (588) ;mRNA; r:41860-43623